MNTESICLYYCFYIFPEHALCSALYITRFPSYMINKFQLFFTFFTTADVLLVYNFCGTNPFSHIKYHGYMKYPKYVLYFFSLFFWDNTWLLFDIWVLNQPLRQIFQNFILKPSFKREYFSVRYAFPSINTKNKENCWMGQQVVIHAI